MNQSTYVYSSICLVGTPLGPSESVPTWQVTPRQRGLCWGGGGGRVRGEEGGWVKGGEGCGWGGEGGGAYTGQVIASTF